MPDLREIIQRHVAAHSRFGSSLALIEKKLSAQLRMAEVAAAQGLSTHAFSMAFGRLFGVSPKVYLNRRLNEEILRTLTESDVSMREIAERFGFSDEYYFNRFFKKNEWPVSLKVSTETVGREISALCCGRTAAGKRNEQRPPKAELL